ncbi:MAG: hypothetical protein ACK4NF_03960, partial [Planctomycetota bacterium]
MKRMRVVLGSFLFVIIISSLVVTQTTEINLIKIEPETSSKFIFSKEAFSGKLTDKNFSNFCSIFQPSLVFTLSYTINKGNEVSHPFMVADSLCNMYNSDGITR